MDIHEQLWIHSLWVETTAFTARFYIREDRQLLVLLIDPTLKRLEQLDYYI